MPSNNKKLVAAAYQALHDMKYEIAAEIGLSVQPGSGEDYWGQVTSRDAGRCGGQITRRLVALAEQALAGGTV
ncbi:alpha/beta-type small acid-soluble spore protein [Alicyclobacillus macrosporangiidus]|uniref:Small, acid-soluble spore protein, alpha/beta type n=1 Tax=Alicyclobacillus macrosporangiidus TaxID=392015 RepID=A0A1I7IIC7_9BACL|nr:alpha/beta-type small acid-soluble spore protein [Alicyclobacillus macrosporangiidus]SFU72626.1 Small, acid-soluble spore protein, alpha/beta type [Alicyclobacillus macrosporangiidus]